MENTCGINDNTVLYYIGKNTFSQTKKQEESTRTGNCSFPCLPCMERQRLFRFLKNNKELFLKNWAEALKETHSLSSKRLGDGNDKKGLEITETSSYLDNHLFPDKFFLSAKFKNKNLLEEMEIKTVVYVSSRAEKKDGCGDDNNLVISNSILFETKKLLDHNQTKNLHDKLFKENDFIFLSERREEIYTDAQESVWVEMFIANGAAEIIERISSKEISILVPVTRKMYVERWNNILKLSGGEEVSKDKLYFEARKHSSVKTGYSASFLNIKIDNKSGNRLIFTGISSNPTVLQNNLLDDIKSHLSLC